MPAWITPAILFHVGAGASWLAATLAFVALRRPPRWLCAVQLIAAAATMLVGIDLWHLRPPGSAERLLTAGTVFAFIAFGLQLPIAGLGLIEGPRRLSGGARAVAGLGLIFLSLAAAAMVASRYG